MSSSSSLRPCLLAAALALLTADAQAGVITAHSATDLPGFFTSAFPDGGTAKVSGFATTVGGVPYDGEGYVVGPKTGGTVTPYTLTSYNGLPYIINDRFGAGKDRITVELSFPIYSISFDYEIFPNANMADGRGKTSASPGWPDFTFKADGVEIFKSFGVMPGAGTFGYTSSPNNAAEYAPQFVGSSGAIALPGVTKLEFIDWPPVIAVNNVQFSTMPPAMPEPATLTVFGLCVVAAGAYGCRRKRPD